MTDEWTMQERVEYLEEENRQLRDYLKPTLTFPHVWKLGPKEAELLAMMYAGGGQPVSHERIFAMIWGDSVPVRAYEVTVSHLRRKLKACGSCIEIVTTWGVGYRLTKQSVAIIDRALGDIDDVNDMLAAYDGRGIL